jgi:hypothetical protein
MWGAGITSGGGDNEDREEKYGVGILGNFHMMLWCLVGGSWRSGMGLCLGDEMIEMG